MGNLSLVWALPFFGTLLAIAVGPIWNPKRWEESSFKILLICPVILLLAMLFTFGGYHTYHEAMHSLLEHYIPLMALLLSLFTVTGGIQLEIKSATTARLNTMILAVGSFFAGWIGTTGASMLFIRPLLRLNKGRKYIIHVVIFFIFTVSNMGGALTPLGDPPLFMGFLEGVDFFWTVKNLYWIIALTLLVILGIFYGLDNWLLNKETEKMPKAKTEIKIEGGYNLTLLAAIVVLSMLSGIINLGFINILSVKLKVVDVIKDILLFFIVYLSWRFTKKSIRDANEFSFNSFKEVAEIFFAIFLTIIPVTHMLKAGHSGCFGWMFDWVAHDNLAGELDPFRIFWACGIMSSILDNAPSYLMFFHLAGGDAAHLMHVKTILMAISLGAVYMGALTYIGNAPNLMVRSIAAEYGVKMPSFFGYLGWSAGILLPLFLIGSALLF